jgi:hypothetical protein
MATVKFDLIFWKMNESMAFEVLATGKSFAASHYIALVFSNKWVIMDHLMLL